MIKETINNFTVEKSLLFLINCMFSLVSFSAESSVGKWQTINDESGKPKSNIEI